MTPEEVSWVMWAKFWYNKRAIDPGPEEDAQIVRDVMETNARVEARCLRQSTEIVKYKPGPDYKPGDIINESV